MHQVSSIIGSDGRKCEYKKATIEDIDALVKTRIIVLRAANKLPDDVDMSEMEKESYTYYRRALETSEHIAYLVYDNGTFIGAGVVSFYQVMPTYHNPTGRKAYIMKGNVRTMAFDFKKEYKEFYMPKNKPEIVNVPKANYIAVRGKGNPNEEGGAYQQAISVLYSVAYTLKMSYKTDYKIEGFFEYVVPPLEGFWWQENADGIDYTDKASFNWISVIRLPDFISKADFDWAVETATKKKKFDCSSAEYLTIEEGLCVQIMHLGSFDDEPATVALMDTYLEQNGYVNDINQDRLHHEIYMSDARRVAPEKWKTVIRHPIRKA